MPTPTNECVKCGETSEFQVSGCPICYKVVCYRCSLNFSGRNFCSQACADYFFHGDEDEPVKDEG